MLSVKRRGDEWNAEHAVAVVKYQFFELWADLGPDFDLLPPSKTLVRVQQCQKAALSTISGSSGLLPKQTAIKRAAISTRGSFSIVECGQRLWFAGTSPPCIKAHSIGFMLFPTSFNDVSAMIHMRFLQGTLFFMRFHEAWSCKPSASLLIT